MEKEEICDNCGVGGDLKGMRRISDGERVLIHRGNCIDAVKSALESSQREAAGLEELLTKFFKENYESGVTYQCFHAEEYKQIMGILRSLKGKD